MLGETQVVDVTKLDKPQLIVVIDTEEEFDWNAKPDRKANRVSAMQHIDRMQSIFDEYGITPCYVVDYPVASQHEGYQPLLDIYHSGRCEIGAHLHPWVNPPYDEPISRHNTYPGNLPASIERQKLQMLRDIIEQNFGFRPTTYKAGRYGIGPNTIDTLSELGFDIDLSYCPPVDYRSDGGPNFSQTTADPLWFGPQAKMLEIPVTGAYVGQFGRLSHSIYQIAERFSMLRVPGILARLNMLDRLRLSPEGFSSDEHLKITRFLYDQGLRTFTWSLHSPSVVPGMTPYVHNDKDLAKFLDSFRRFFDFFFEQLSGEASTPKQLKIRLETLR